MKTKIFLLSLCLALSVRAGVDIAPKPSDRGNLGQSTNRFPVVYGETGDFEELRGDGSAVTNLNPVNLGSGTLPAGVTVPGAQVSGAVPNATLANNVAAGAALNPINAYAATNLNRTALFGYGALNSSSPYVPRPLTNDVMVPAYGDPLAPLMPTPMIVWNSWYAFPAFEQLPSHFLITNAIHMILSNNYPVRVIEISDGWTAPNRTNGLMVHNWTNFPGGPDAITNTVNYAHAMGFKIRIYTSYNASGLTCGQFIGSTPTTLEADFQQFADWGFDGITVDGCEGWRYHDPDYQLQFNRHVFKALMKAGRKMTVHTANMAGAKNGLNFAEAFSQVNMLSGYNSNRSDGFPHPQEFAVHPLSNVWQTAYTWITGPYYSHFAGQQRPGHYNYSTSFYMAGSTDTENGLKVLRNQLTLLSMFSSPIVMGAYTNTLYLQKVITNAAMLGVHQDPACKYPELVSSNGLFQVWKKPLNGTNFGAVALMMLNLRHSSESAADFTVSPSDLGLDNTRDVIWSDIWRYTNVVATGTRTFSVPPDTASFWIVKHRYIPDGSVGDEQVLTFQNLSLFGTGMSKNDMQTVGPAPWYNHDGMTQSGANNVARIGWPVPAGVRSAQVRYQVAAAAAADVAWTNYLQLSYTGPSGRILFDPASFAGTTNRTVVAPNGSFTWHTNWIFWTATNTPTFLGVIWNASTNTGARYMLSPLYVKYGY